MSETMNAACLVVALFRKDGEICDMLTIEVPDNPETRTMFDFVDTNDKLNAVEFLQKLLDQVKSVVNE